MSLRNVPANILSEIELLVNFLRTVSTNKVVIPNFIDCPLLKKVPQKQSYFSVFLKAYVRFTFKVLIGELRRQTVIVKTLSAI